MPRRLNGYQRSKLHIGISGKDLRVSNFYEKSMIDLFLNEKVYNGEGSPETVILTSDIYMLFNQRRLDKLTSQALIQHFESMSQRDSSLASLRSKLTDDQLVRFVKSRYIQSPGELLSWSKYLVSLYGEDYAKFQELTQPKQPVPKEPEQSPTPQTE